MSGVVLDCIDYRSLLYFLLVPMLNLTVVVFTSVLGTARKPLYNDACVIIVYEQNVSERVTKKW